MVEDIEKIERYSWLFVYKEWAKLSRLPIPDKGFEESFREYLYKKVDFDTVSDIRDMGLGMSYSTFSDVAHELDVVCRKGSNIYVFELKHYNESYISKEIVFTFLGKVLDFYLKNIENLATYKITMVLLTINRNIDDSIRKLCIAYGIKLIDPLFIPLVTLEYYSRDLYQKIPEDLPFKLEIEGSKLLENVSELREGYDYSFSDLFKCLNGRIEIACQVTGVNTNQALHKLKECNSLFKKFKEEHDLWKSKKS